MMFQTYQKFIAFDEVSELEVMVYDDIVNFVMSSTYSGDVDIDLNREQVEKLVNQLSAWLGNDTNCRSMRNNARRALMQMPADTPFLEDALNALGYDDDGMPMHGSE